MRWIERGADFRVFDMSDVRGGRVGSHLSHLWIDMDRYARDTMGRFGDDVDKGDHGEPYSVNQNMTASLSFIIVRCCRVSEAETSLPQAAVVRT
jgi:hypothetical protein